MALLHMDGFDGYSSASDLYTMAYTGGSINFTTSGGRYGGGALALFNGGYQLMTPIAALETWVGFALYLGSSGNSECILCKWSSGSYDEAMVTINPLLGQLSFWSGRSNILLGQYTGLNGNAWHWLDIHYKADGTAGVAELWLDGTQVLNVTGVNSTRSSPSSLASFCIGDNGIAGPQSSFIDDLVIVDTAGTTNNGRIGDHKIVTLQPTSDAGTNNGTPSSGADHYAMVADATWDASTYDTITNTSGQEELFGFADISGSPTNIAAVKVSHISQKTDTGDASLQTVVVSSGTVSSGSSQALGTSWSKFFTLLEADPHTSAAWTASAVNALTAGVKVP